MPVLNGQLDPDGHAVISVGLVATQPRRRALHLVGQAIQGVQVVPGLIDTGATFTVIDPQLRQALNLVPFRVRSACVPWVAAPVRALAYKVDLIVLHPIGPPLIRPMLTVLEMPLAHTGNQVALGCDVLAQCEFTYRGAAGTFSLAY
jgi:hypothetical protein